MNRSWTYRLWLALLMAGATGAAGAKSLSGGHKGACLGDSIVCKGDSIVRKGDSTVRKSDSTVCKSDSTVCKSDSTVCKSDSTVCKSDSTVCKSDSTVCKSDSTVCKSDSTVCHCDSIVCGGKCVVCSCDSIERMGNRIVEESRKIVEESRRLVERGNKVVEGGNKIVAGGNRGIKANENFIEVRQRGAKASERVIVHGSVQSEVFGCAKEDALIGTERTGARWKTNTYAEMSMRWRKWEAGARLEYMPHPLPGYAEEMKGWGVPFFYVRRSGKRSQITLGDYYEQFGAGLILRTYEERSLGIDNALRGAHLLVSPWRGMRLKLLAGQQRYYWASKKWNGDAPWTAGGDLEVNVGDWWKALRERGQRLNVGLSGVVNRGGEEAAVVAHRGAAEGVAEGDYRLRLPRNVGAVDVRAQWQKGAYNVLVEYARKGDDPSSVNGYAWGKGSALLLSSAYAKRGMSLLIQAKRSENMAFRSRRTIDKASAGAYLNHLPAFTQQHSYALMGLYPYATQMVKGEWAWQAVGGYRWKRGTAWGGKYGMGVKVHLSYVRGLPQGENRGEATQIGEDRRGCGFWKWGKEVYYEEANMKWDKRWTRRWKTHVMVAYQRYNQAVVEGHGAQALRSKIVALEAQYKWSKRLAVRSELQYLHAKEGQKDWWFGLVEVSVLPHLMIGVSDMYNGHVKKGEGEGEAKVHYLLGTLTYSHKAHRLQAAYGKTRAGYNCAGGVCRYMPATRGLTLSYSYNF